MLSVLRPIRHTAARGLRSADAARGLATTAARANREDEIARLMELVRQNALAAGKARPTSGGEPLRMLMFGKPGAGKVSLAGSSSS